MSFYILIDAFATLGGGFVWLAQFSDSVEADMPKRKSQPLSIEALFLNNRFVFYDNPSQLKSTHTQLELEGFVTV